MSTTFPTSLQDLDATRGTSGQPLSSPNHITHHTTEDDTIEALQAKVGVDNSAVTTSLDYKLKSTSSVDPGHKHTTASLSVSGLTASQLLRVNSGGTAIESSGKTAPSGAIVGDTDTQTLTNKTISGASNTISNLAESTLSLSDNTTNNASSTKHGFLPKLSNSASEVLLGTGVFGAAPAAGFVSGVLSDLTTTSAGNNDATVTTTFTPRLIILYYFIQGFDGSGGTGYTGRKGIAVYNGTTLQFDFPNWNVPDNANKMSGDDGYPGGTNTVAALGASLVNIPNSTSAPASGGTNSVTLSINSVSSTTFVVRRATVVGDGTKNCRAKIAYIAFA